VLDGLAAVASSHTAEEREVAFVSIAIGGLALGRGLGGDVEQHGDRRRR
jgi:hypothetical protein